MWLGFLVVELSLTSSESEQGREKRGLAMEKARQAAKRREAALEAKVLDQRCDFDAPQNFFSTLGCTIYTVLSSKSYHVEFNVSGTRCRCVPFRRPPSSWTLQYPTPSGK